MQTINVHILIWIDFDDKDIIKIDEIEQWTYTLSIQRLKQCIANRHILKLTNRIRIFFFDSKTQSFQPYKEHIENEMHFSSCVPFDVNNWWFTLIKGIIFFIKLTICHTFAVSHKFLLEMWNVHSESFFVQYWKPTLLAILIARSVFLEIRFWKLINWKDPCGDLWKLLLSVSNCLL